MLFGDYHFFCQFTDDTILPHYKGSTLRGVFGRALKRVVCVLRRQECIDCLLKERCLYALSFETANVPPPFVLEPSLADNTHFSKDEIIDFHLLLFGEINKSLPYIIYALKEAQGLPVGKGINGNKAGLSLLEVRREGKIIYSDDKQTINTKDLYYELKMPLLNEGKKKDILKLKINLITPLRLKFRNKLKADLPFHVLIRAVLRRISSLFYYYGDGEPGLDYKGLVKKAEFVKTVESNIDWFDWRRYSFRQDQAMLMGGIIGSVTYEGDISEFIPLIELCEKLHIGKQTSFGLGKIKAKLLT